MISFEVAKAIKYAGYPQGNTDKCYLTSNHNQFYKEGQIVENDDGEWAVLTKNLADIPTYLEVWLWLWREKKIPISILYDEDNLLDEHWYPNSEAAVGYIGSFTDVVFHKDPEETIIAAIEYLVENNLIK